MLNRETKEIEEKVYIALCVIFSVLIVVGTLIYQKFVVLHIFTFYIFELSAGTIIYPFTFMIIDLIAEFYGKSKANYCVRLAIAMNITVVLLINAIDKLNATDWSKIDNTTFHTVFGSYSISFIVFIIACYITQCIDIIIYLWIQKLTRGKWLWVRNNVSTALSLFIDTIIVIAFMNIFGVLPRDYVWNVIVNSYMYKLFFIVSSTPLFYLLVWAVQLKIKPNVTLMYPGSDN
jgi:uncharacterized integral membrane protein (TIGR00697 family)